MSDQKKLPDPRENKMGIMPVGKLLFSMALPMAISMLVQAFYNVVDSIYVAQVSESAVTALGLAFPIQNLQIGCATGVAVGMNSLLSKSLGENNRERANRAAGNAIGLTLILAVAFVIFGFAGSRPYYEMQSDVAATVEGGTAYIAICSIFGLGVFVQILCERLLQSSGRTIFTMFSQGSGAILNIVLDPLFIFGFEPLGIPKMGVAGAAVATVIGQWAGAVLGIIFNLKCNPDVKFSLKYLKPDMDIIRKILAVGVPSIIMMAIGSIMNFSMNQIFMGFRDYGETATAVFSVYFKRQRFFLMPLFGINNAYISSIAFNYGARKPERITKTLKLALCAAMSIMLTGLAVFQLIPHLLMQIFSSAQEASASAFMDLGVRALQVVSLHFPIAAIGIALGASFQALGNGIYSTITSLCRQLLVLVPAAWLLSLTGQVNAVWWSFPIAEVVSCILSLLFFARIYRQKVKPIFPA